MGMTIDKAILRVEHSSMSVDDKETANFIINTLRKYQTMQEVLEDVWKVPAIMLDESECLNKIMETYRTVRY